MKRPELLAPAGNKECLIAAIEAGCDAIYLGGKSFGARGFAQNFSDEELVEYIKYAHLYGVKIYVTVNTLIYDDEVDEFLSYIDFLHKNNVDAVIIQDLGMADLVRKTYPNLEIHASTQMHIHNIEGVKLAKELGFKRVVLARETSINDIKKIKDQIDMPLEIFIHGALCVSYSGQCLMSSLIGGRSGNRGTCAQCCRLKYDVVSDNKKVNLYNYPLSTKDLCTIEYIDQLIEAGVDSFKIEGRMKRPEYVYLVTSIYRKAIDNYLKSGKTNITSNDILKLKKIFNREFTKGFLFGEKNDNFMYEKRPNHIGVQIGEVISYHNRVVTVKLSDNISKNDGIRIITDNNDVGGTLIKIYKNNKEVNEAFKGDIITFKIEGNIKKGNRIVKTSDFKDLEEINKCISLKTRKVKINGSIKCYIGHPILLELTDGVNKVVLESDYIVEKASNIPTTKDRIEKQLKKLGSTIYSFSKLTIDVDDSAFIRIDKINEIRRNATIELDKKRLYSYEYKKENYTIDVQEFKSPKGFNYLINSMDDYNSIKNKEFNEIYVSDTNLYKQLKDNNVILKLPRVINKYSDYDIPLMVGEIGSLIKYKNVYTDFSLNVTNSYTVAFLHSLGVKRVTLSYEMTDMQIKYLIESYIKRYNKKPNLELIVSSYPEAMISKYNLLEKYNLKGNNNYLRQKNNLFKLEYKDNLMYVYHYEKKELNDYDKYFDMGINVLRKNL